VPIAQRQFVAGQTGQPSISLVGQQRSKMVSWKSRGNAVGLPNARVFAAILGLLTPTLAYGSDEKRFWCRNGYFPSEQKSLKLAIASGEKGKRIPIFWDDKECPRQGASCRQMAYVIPGDELIVNHVEDGWACAWYQGKKSETVGWVRTDEIAIRDSSDDGNLKGWIGTWKYYDDEVTISSKDGQTLTVRGRATWLGLVVNGHRVTHTGGIKGEALPSSNHAHVGQSGCEADLTRIGRYLIVTDNRQCGGANVRLDGVYLKRTAEVR
jgi:hypothetical protein